MLCMGDIRVLTVFTDYGEGGERVNMCILKSLGFQITAVALEFNLSVFILRTYVLQILQVLQRLSPETEESLGSIALK